MVSAPGIPADVAAAPDRPVRRWRRRLAVAVSVLLVLVLLAAGGIAWYFSGVALAVDHSVDYPATVLSVGRSATGTATVRLTRSPVTTEPGEVLGLEWVGGYGQVGPVLSQDASSVTRTYTPLRSGTPVVGARVRIDSDAFTGDPRSALGLDFSQVSVPGPLGALPSWYVPAAGPAPAAPTGSGSSGAVGAASPAASTWVVFVHGHDADREESLRYLRTWHAWGLPVLVPSYRDDVGAPSSPDRWHHLGDTEWQDVAAAVRWAHAHGASGVVLAGWSMGGAVSLQTADRAGAEVSGLVRGLLLDSPVVDWQDVFATQGADRGLPGVEVTLAEWALQWRSGIDLGRLDWASRARQLRVPTLILHSDSDDYVPDGPAVRLAAARPDLVTLVRVPGARHTLDWNVDPVRYDAAMRDWLVRLGVLPRP